MQLPAFLSRGLRRFWGGGSRLQYGAIAFVFLVCLAVIAVEAANLWQQRTEQMDDAWQDAANLARSLAQHAEDTARSADVSIVGIVHRLQIDGTAPEDFDQLTRIMTARLSMSPALATQIIMEASGRARPRRTPFPPLAASRISGKAWSSTERTPPTNRISAGRSAM